MKKFLGILVLGLLWCSVGVAGSLNVSYGVAEKLPKDVASGSKFYKILFWRHLYETMMDITIF